MKLETMVLLNHMLPNVSQTVISFVIVFVITLLIYMFFFRKSPNKKYKNIVRKRLIYIMLLLDILILTKIWVDGFSHIITILSLMAAGLVVANKESVMNLIGGLIINWRDLFVEGDFIQIQNFSGYVFSLGIMYFRLYETVSVDQKKATGRTIKIPNSLVITSPVINFSPDSNLHLYKIEAPFNPDKFLKNQMQHILESITRILKETYEGNSCYQKAYVKAHNPELSRLIQLHPSVSLHSNEDKFHFLIYFYCFSVDYQHITEQFWLSFDF